MLPKGRNAAHISHIYMQPPHICRVTDKYQHYCPCTDALQHSPKYITNFKI